MHADLLLLQAGKSVKRLRLLERRLSLVVRLGAVGVAVGLAGLGAYYQTWRAERRETPRLIEPYVAHAKRSIEAGDLIGSLPWLAEALRECEESLSRVDAQSSPLAAKSTVGALNASLAKALGIAEEHDRGFNYLSQLHPELFKRTSCASAPALQAALAQAAKAEGIQTAESLAQALLRTAEERKAEKRIRERAYEAGLELAALRERFELKRERFMQNASTDISFYAKEIDRLSGILRRQIELHMRARTCLT